MHTLKIKKTLKKQIIPLSKDEFELLEQNILRDGIREPLAVWKGTILDGHNRYEIAKRHKLPFSTEEIEIKNLSEARVWMIKNQLGKRNLSVFAKVELALELQEIIAKQARRNQTRGVSLKLDEGIDTGAVLAEIASCSRATFFKVKKCLPLLSNAEKEELRKGELSINAAFNRASVREHERKIKSVPFPKGKYRVLYADPPWKYASYSRTQQSSSICPYPTMTIDELCSLAVKDLTTTSSMLFLWSTATHLEKAFQVMKAWGFVYTGSMFVWEKTNTRTLQGNYNKPTHELLLIGKRKKSQNFSTKKHRSVVRAAKTNHSKKPAIFREIIEDLGYGGRKLELFAREKNDGWDAWGNEL
jgi:N6-adenosine-specific RNA methylase IME4